MGCHAFAIHRTRRRERAQRRRWSPEDRRQAPVERRRPGVGRQRAESTSRQLALAAEFGSARKPAPLWAGRGALGSR
jgi:hypothetical protein